MCASNWPSNALLPALGTHAGAMAGRAPDLGECASQSGTAELNAAQARKLLAEVNAAARAGAKPIIMMSLDPLLHSAANDDVATARCVRSTSNESAT